MSSQFRPTRPEDAAAISRFLQRVFNMSPAHPGLDPRQMEWKYWREYPGWEGSRGFVMERAGEIVAHGSVVPLTCVWDNRRLRMVDLIDWAAGAASPGAGIALLKRVSQLVDGVFIAGGTEAAQKVFRSLGFRDCVSAAKFALPVRPLTRFVEDREPSWKRPARVVRNTMWLMQAPSTSSAGWTARRLPPGRVAQTEFPKPRLRSEAAAFERSSAEIAFLLECPATPAELYLVEKNGSVCGYFVLTLAVAQCRIADAWIESGTPEDWRALYTLATREARSHRQILEIVTVVTNDPAARQGLHDSGFRERGAIPLRVSIPGGAYPQDLRYQLVDNDSAWLHDGNTYYWT